MTTRISSQCQLVEDYRISGATVSPIKVFEVLLTVNDATGQSVPGSTVYLTADQPVSLTYEGGGQSVSKRIAPGTSISVTTSSLGRCRFTIDAGSTLSCSPIKVRTDTMAANQWQNIYPDHDLHQKLSKVTGSDLKGYTATPTGMKAKSPLAGSAVKNDDAEALAANVRKVMLACTSGQLPRAATSSTSQTAVTNQPIAFGLLGDIEKAGKSAVGAVSGAASSVEHSVENAADSTVAALGGVFAHPEQAIEQPLAQFTSSAIHQADQLAVADFDSAAKSMTVYVALGNSLYKTLVKDVEGAAQVVQGFFAKLGAALVDVWNFFASIFDWGDILQTLDAMTGTAKQVLAALPKQVSQVKSGILAQLTQFEQTITTSLAKAAADKNSQTPNTLPKTDKSDTLAPGKSGHVDFLRDRIESHLGSASADSSTSTSDSSDVMTQLMSQLGSAFADLKTAFAASDLSKVFADPSKLSSIGAADVIKAAGALIEVAFTIVKGAVTIIFDAAELVLDGLQALLEAHINIPCLTPILEHVVLGGRKLNLLTLVLLLAAACYTVSYKVITGSAHGPCSGSAKSFAAQDDAVLVAWAHVGLETIVGIVNYSLTGSAPTPSLPFMYNLKAWLTVIDVGISKPQEDALSTASYATEMTFWSLCLAAAAFKFLVGRAIAPMISTCAIAAKTIEEADEILGGIGVLMFLFGVPMKLAEWAEDPKGSAQEQRLLHMIELCEVMTYSTSYLVRTDPKLKLTLKVLAPLRAVVALSAALDLTVRTYT